MALEKNMLGLNARKQKMAGLNREAVAEALSPGKAARLPKAAKAVGPTQKVRRGKADL